MNIKLSIIVTVYNVEQYLEKCLESIACQDYKNYELIIVNDCSTDNSLNIIKKYISKIHYIKILNNKSNIGQSLSNNIGLDNAIGEYILFIDADDWIEEGCFSKIIAKITLKDSDICLIGVKRYDDSLNILENFAYYNRNELNTKLQKRNNILYWPEEIFKCFTTWSKLIKHSFIKKNNFRFNDIKLGEDVFFHIRCILKANNIAICNDNLYVYRVREGSKMMSKMKKEQAQSIISFMKLVYDYIINIEENQIGLLEEFKKFVKTQYNFYLYKKVCDKEFKIYMDENVKKLLSLTNIKTKNDKNFNFLTSGDIFISIIIPVYNAQKYLMQNYKSIKSNKFDNYEIIYIDDGSSDNSPEILDRLRNENSRISVINQANCGAGNARNKAMKLAKGQYLLFLDADDEYIEYFLDEIVIGLNQYKFPDIMMWRFYVRDPLNKNNKWVKPDIEFNYIDGENLTYKNLPYSKISSSTPYNKIYKTKFIKDYKIEFQEISSCNDVGFVWLAFEFAKTIYFLNKILYIYNYKSPSSISNKRHLKADNIIKCGEFIRNNLISRGIKSHDKLYISLIDTMSYERCQYPEQISALNYDLSVKFFLGKKYYDIYLQKIIEMTKKEYDILGSYNKNFDISYILIIFNKEKDIKQIIENLIKIYNSNIQIICIDNGSTDNTQNILKLLVNIYKNIIFIVNINKSYDNLYELGNKIATGKNVQFKIL